MQKIHSQRPDVATQIGQQVDFVNDAQPGALEYIRILQGLVVTLGDAYDNHAPGLAQIEHGRTDQIADILDEEQRTCRQVERQECVVHHGGIEMAPLCGIDLPANGSGCRNAARIIVGMLVTFDDRHGKFPQERQEGLFEKRRFPGSGRTDDIHGTDFTTGKILPILLGLSVVEGENVFLDRQSVLMVMGDFLPVEMMMKRVWGRTATMVTHDRKNFIRQGLI